jgi:uncharacterized membrane protein YgdD (TMEM256/DUF423 family)
VINPETQTAKHVIDGTLAAGAISAPAWVEHVTTYGGLVMLIGGLALLILRIVIAWRDYRAPP